MKLLVDMNLTPAWCPLLAAQGWETRHWCEIGAPGAADSEILDWASANGYVVLTHDLDFGAILAATGNDSPSVVQLRGQDVMPAAMGSCAIMAVKQFEEALKAGALVVVDAGRARARLLPLR
jgi:predicted nuclease of predicted toxin-antitoxin system